MTLKGPPKKEPKPAVIGKGYVQANITEIRRIAAAVRFRLERVAKAESRCDDEEARYLDAVDELDEDPSNSDLRRRVQAANKKFNQARSRLTNARAWAAYTQKRFDLYLDHALKHTLKNNHPASKAVWAELRLLDKQRKWERTKDYTKSFVEFLRESAA